MTHRPPALVLLTDRRARGPHCLLDALSLALSDLPSGTTAIWFRDRDMDKEARLALGKKVARVAREYGAPLWVSEDPALARKLQAEALQLPDGHSPPRGWDGPWGLAVHQGSDVTNARRKGASWLVISPVHRVPGKGPPLGPEGLKRMVELAHPLPVVALGGITPENIAGVSRSGVCAVACVRAVLESPDPAAIARSLWSTLREENPTL